MPVSKVEKVSIADAPQFVHTTVVGVSEVSGMFVLDRMEVDYGSINLFVHSTSIIRVEKNPWGDDQLLVFPRG